MSARILSLATVLLLAAASAAQAQPDQRRSTLPGASVDQMHARAQPQGGGAPVHPAHSRPPRAPATHHRTPSHEHGHKAPAASPKPEGVQSR
jgi:hypothetical protein